MLRYKGEETSLNAFSKLAQRQAPFDKLDLFTQYMVVYLSFNCSRFHFTTFYFI